ncbi:uncharacterized protein LOC131851100 [Achroia grisella]|uniref:uncharacterized protein LOC131851100 n=1 Tax=Achroia grisella TaxID=688607 RepID=UPI0027D1EE97|nr:uncharacterized protein LOC131851100 [Achroia grisella]
MKYINVFIYVHVITTLESEEIQSIHSKNHLPYFRRKVEEALEDNITERASSDNPHLVSFLIKNVKEIFNELYNTDSTKITTISHMKIAKDNIFKQLPTRSTLLFNVNVTLSTFSSNNVSAHLLLNDAMVYNDNFSSTNFSNESYTSSQLPKDFYKLTERHELMRLSKNLMFFETDQKDFSILKKTDAFTLNASEYDIAFSRRSCIACNNVITEDCNDPKNKLISSVICARDDDLCYSLHTPFGIIDRGCFNTNHNLTTYVCSCNLCNYISISEMPYIFSKKQDWIDNVVELSRTRHFRKTVFKDMSCLKCEVNMTIKKGDMLDKANCLEGNVGTLPLQKCQKNEICAVKAIKNDGYIWRGCIKSPLYNYWWTFCDSDLCNYDAIASLYDTD